MGWKWSRWRQWIHRQWLKFYHKLNLLSNIEKEKQGIPNVNQMQQIKAGWFKRIKTLESIIFECGSIKSRRANSYVKAVAIVWDLKIPHITCDSKLDLKDKLMVKLDKLKQSKETKFNSITNFTVEEIIKWWITFVSVNEESSSFVVQLKNKSRDIEEDIFNECVKQECLTNNFLLLTKENTLDLVAWSRNNRDNTTYVFLR